MWVVAVTEVERTPEHADCVVECLSAAAVRIRHARECHVVDPQEGQGAYPRTPECIEHASVARDCRPREIVPPESGLAMSDELVEHLIAGPDLGRIDHATEEPVLGEFLIEVKRAGADPLPDASQPLAG